MHQLVTLAQAWFLTKNNKYSEEFFSQWNSWYESNPFCEGIHWTNTMEVAIRSVNIITAIDLISSAPGWSKNKDIILNSLRQHGKFIEHNLELGIENNKISKGNHYLANICGMAIIGISCKSFPESERWAKVGIGALEYEMNSMVTRDGFFFESSTGYHRLSLELFLFPFIILEKSKQQFSAGYASKLEKMLDTVMALNTPGNTIPNIGDSDDGRLLILSNYKNWNRNDHRYLLGLCSILFNRSDYKYICSECPEEIFWIFGEDGVRKFNELDVNLDDEIYKNFDQAGLFIIQNRKENDYTLLTSGTSYPNAPMAHRHNDSLSIELWLKAKPVVVDIGTYCYTGDIHERNYFRSTKSHNTIMIDSQEMNQISDEPFSLTDNINCEVKVLKNDSNNIYLEFIRNDKRLTENSVIVKRNLFYDYNKAKLLILDDIVGTNSHSSNWFWNFHPDIKLNIIKKNDTAIFDFGFGRMKIKKPECNRFSYTITNGWYSQSYGIKQKSQVLNVRCDWMDKISLTTEFR